MKQSKVVKVTYKKPWESKNGTMHSWHVTMDNGDAGECNTKTADKGPWEVGDDASYTVDGKEYNGNTYYKITKITPFQTGKTGGAGKAWTPDPEKETRMERWAKQRLIVRQSSWSAAIHLANTLPAGEVDGAGYVKDLAHMIEEDVYRGIDVRALMPKAEAPTVTNDPQPVMKAAPKPQPVIADDDLPF